MAVPFKVAVRVNVFVGSGVGDGVGVGVAVGCGVAVGVGVGEGVGAGVGVTPFGTSTVDGFCVGVREAKAATPPINSDTMATIMMAAFSFGLSFIL